MQHNQSKKIVFKLYKFTDIYKHYVFTISGESDGAQIQSSVEIKNNNNTYNNNNKTLCIGF